jgi:hypothetical protein
VVGWCFVWLGVSYALDSLGMGPFEFSVGVGVGWILLWWTGLDTVTN